MNGWLAEDDGKRFEKIVDRPQCILDLLPNKGFNKSSGTRKVVMIRDADEHREGEIRVKNERAVRGWW